jgi:hypothetical protein
VKFCKLGGYNIIKKTMDYHTFLSSIIKASSLVFAIGIPFIIYSVTNYNNRRERLLSEIKTLYPAFNDFRKLIYTVFQIDFWKEKSTIGKYQSAIRKGDQSEMDFLKRDNEILSLYEAYRFISNNYCNEVMSDEKKLFTIKDIRQYKIYTNYIWYTINCRTDFIPQIEIDSLNELDEFGLKRRINEIIKKSFKDYSSEPISVNLIANIAGQVEMEIIDLLEDLTNNYERPLEPIVKRLFLVLIVALLFGIIFPLMLLVFTPTYALLASIIILCVMIICFFTIIILTGKHIQGLYKNNPNNTIIKTIKRNIKP